MLTTFKQRCQKTSGIKKLGFAAMCEMRVGLPSAWTPPYPGIHHGKYAQEA